MTPTLLSRAERISQTLALPRRTGGVKTAERCRRGAEKYILLIVEREEHGAESTAQTGALHSHGGVCGGGPARQQPLAFADRGAVLPEALRTRELAESESEIESGERTE